jgi:hypothetical protein
MLPMILQLRCLGILYIGITVAELGASLYVGIKEGKFDFWYQ